MALIDTHAHLEELPDLPAALESAALSGVVAVVAVGSGLESNRRTLELARQFPGRVLPALGLHPWELARGEGVEEALAFIEANIGQAVAVGEVGLDYQKDLVRQAGKELQHRVLEKLLDIARRHDRPVLLHSRYAWADALELVLRSGVRRAVFHWFTGPSGVLRGVVEAGFYLSATPAITYHQEHRRAVREAPLDRLLLETDSPVTYRDLGRPAQPADVAGVAEAVAAIKGLSVDEVARAITANAAALLRISVPEPVCP